MLFRNRWNGYEAENRRESTTLSDFDQWFAGTLDWATIGRLWDNKGGSRLRSKYLAKVARSVSADDFPLQYIPFSSRLLEKRTHELLLSQPNSYQWQEVEAHLIEMFTERSAECEDITRFTGFFVEDLILNIGWATMRNGGMTLLSSTREAGPTMAPSK